jgi:hypothetical protein
VSIAEIRERAELARDAWVSACPAEAYSVRCLYRLAVQGEVDRAYLLALLDEAATALRFYADGEHLTTNTWDGSTAAENGAKARAVLTKLEVGK